ncbi:MAG: M43 family zinc metalloprotease [Saprospiraceae bacterium]
MKNRIALMVMLFILTVHIGILAQNNVQCGFDIGMKSMEALHPGFIEASNKVFKEIKHISDQNHTTRNDIIEVPVVVHIVWKNESENLDDSLITSQLEVLNAAFNLQNKNKDILRPIFKDLQEDAKIRFTLYEVKRIKTSQLFEPSILGLPDEVKQTLSGGSDALDTEQHINIWVCKLQPIAFLGGQILGYSYPPSGLPNWPENVSAPEKELDGIVIDYRAFGRNNPNPFVVSGVSYDLHEGLTTVHEMGHYLGLRHIWGDGNAIFGGNSCTEDDGIDDTPNQGEQSNFQCDYSQNTCNNGVGDLPDLIENYMDYSGEACQCMFTKEQVQFMRTVITTKRNSLVGTKNEVSLNHFSLAPNPVQNILSIKCHSEPLAIRIYDSIGQCQISDFTSTNLDVSQLPSGWYTCQISTDSGVFTESFIKY